MKREYVVISKGLSTHYEFHTREEAVATIYDEFDGDDNARIEEYIDGKIKHMAHCSDGVWTWHKVVQLKTGQERL